MEIPADLDFARDAHKRQAWADACAAFSAVDREAPLAIEDLESLGEAAQVLGRGDETVQVLRRAYQGRVDAGELGAAVRCAYWLQDAMTMKRDFAQAAAWLARAARLVEDRPDCAERGYLLLPQAEQELRQGDFATAFATASRAAELGAESSDPNLVTLAIHIQGRCRVKQGWLEEGLALLDEAMINVVGGDLEPRVTGLVYCNVIGSCHEVYEVRRAREWTTALNLWCDSRPQFTGAYSGICRIHRSQLLQLGGDWPDAVLEAKLACAALTQGYGEIVAGGAFYQLGEVHRLRGEMSEADEAYRTASRYGSDTQPGLSLLRLAQGKTEAAVAAIGRALSEVTNQTARARLLPAYVEIMLSAGELDLARQGATELAEIAGHYDRPALYAHAAHTRGAVQLAEGDPGPALAALRRAWSLWRDLDVPYEAARIRVLVGLACRALGDDDTAAMELDAARHVLRQLGATPELARVEALSRKRSRADTGGLTPRELEVLRLVSVGKSNQAIAAELFLSEKTVARHMSNIFGKLGVSSRTAAAAYAFDHGLL
ncbi:MAG TPA: helix-turn-helix transcriptional regulator [Micromonosporaceae bacterium]|nr:helix-turn-helix transcriptional regulator [Micromonosporaceae bacterium]